MVKTGVKVVSRLLRLRRGSKATQTVKTEQVDRLRKELETLEDRIATFAMQGLVSPIASLSKEDNLGIGRSQMES
jgi:hypothetical protein